jgi:hypothetical protein
LVFLQEVHGDEFDIEVIRHAARQTHTAHYAPGLQRDMGGVLTFSLIAFFDAATNFSSSILVPGRVLVTSWSKGDSILHAMNVHNYGFTSAQRKVVFDTMKAVKARAAAAPHKILFLLLVDFNFPAWGECGAHLGKYGFCRKRDNRVTGGADSNLWKNPLLGMTELAQPSWTRFGGPGNPCLSRFDRIYVIAPAWTLQQLKLRATTVLDVTSFIAIELSDHAPVGAFLSARQLLPRLLRPIPRWFATRKVFKDTVTEMQADVGLSSLAPFDRLLKHKQLARAASSISLKKILARVSRTLDQDIQVLSSAARAVLYDLPQLLPKVTSFLPALSDILTLVNGHVQLLQAGRFTEMVSVATWTHLEREILITEVELPCAKSVRKGRLASLRRFQKM